MFRQAVAYAKEARNNAALWEIYTAEAKRRGGASNAFAVAVSDFRKGLRLRKAMSETKQQKQPINRKEKTEAFRIISEPERKPARDWEPAFPEVFFQRKSTGLKRVALGRADVFT